jgi:hypothetical protein
MESLLTNGAFDVITLGLAIIAVVEGIKRARQSDRGWITIVISGGIGLSAGIAGLYLNYPRFIGLDPLTGLIIGLAASGGITLVRQIAKSE